MDVNDYIRGLADEDLKAELYRRNDEAQKAVQKAMYRKHEIRQAAKYDARQQFCQGIGITLDQFESVEEFIDEEYY